MKWVVSMILTLFFLNSFFGQKEIELDQKRVAFNNFINEGKYNEAKDIGVELTKLCKKKIDTLTYDEINYLFKTVWLFNVLQENKEFLEFAQYGYSRSAEKFGEDNIITIAFLKYACKAHFLLEDYNSCISSSDKILKLQGENFDNDNFFLIYAGQSCLVMNQNEKTDKKIKN